MVLRGLDQGFAEPMMRMGGLASGRVIGELPWVMMMALMIGGLASRLAGCCVMLRGLAGLRC